MDIDGVPYHTIRLANDGWTRLFATVEGFCVQHIRGRRWDVRVLRRKA